MTGERDATETLRRDFSKEPLGAVIQVVVGKAEPGSFKLESGTCRIGAGPDNDVVVEDKAVSRSHLELSLVPEGVRLRDLNSRNGTFYAGQRVRDITLAPGSHVLLGATELAIHSDVASIQPQGTDGPSRYGELIGQHASMRRLFKLLQRLEGSLVNVLIEGESGTGKELIARALHQHSRIAEQPFVAINCGALDRALVRSELFGHHKGAFTGATASTTGAFDDANGGTLFLDEIGELPFEVQPVLLRVLETDTFSRVGKATPIPVKVRVIAATNRNLKEQVEKGTFRSDLYYRLNVVRVGVPALRERASDVEILAQSFADGSSLGPLPQTVLAELKGRSWPGNVRELKHALLAYSALGVLHAPEETPLAELDAVLSRVLDVTRPYAEQKDELVQRLTRIYLAQLLKHTRGNRSEAARVADLQRGYLRQLLEKHGIDPDA